MNDCASPSNGMALSTFGTAAVVALLCIPGTVLAQGALTNGENHAGAIATPGEIDEWTFTAALGDYILLSVGEVPPGEIDPDFRPWIRLRRPDGLEIGSDSGAIAAQINIEAPLTGTYTVLVRDSTVNRPGNVLGSYVLHFLKAPGTYTIPAGDEGGPLVIGGNTAGRIGAAGATPSLRPGDLDVWTFAAAQNDALVLTIGEVLDSEIDPNFQPWIRLFGPNGDLLGSDLGTLAATLYVNPAPLSGTYTVVVADSNVNREGSAVGDYLLHLAKVPGTAIVPDGDDGGPLTIGANHPGRIGAPGANPTLHRADLDVWTFTAAQNDAIYLSIGEVLTSEIDPDFQPWIRLFGPNGALLGSDLGTLAATIYVNPAPLSGTYTVVVADSNVNRQGSEVGDYVLHLAKVPGTATVQAGDEGGPMTNGTTYTGRIGSAGADLRLNRADLDIWTFTAAQATAITITIGEVLPPPPDPGFNPRILLFGPTGALVASATGLLTASINVNAPLTGVYTLIVADSNINRQGSAVGDYQLSAFFTAAAVPTTVDDAYVTGVDTPLTIPAPGVLANDSSNGGGALSAVLVTAVTAGTLALNANGSFTYTPPGGFSGVVSFTYRAANPVGPGNTATVTITVGQTVPTTVADAFSTNLNTPLNVSAPGVLGNDSSNGGGAMTAQLVSTTLHGVLALNVDGSFSYVPTAGYTGPDAFTYRAVNSVGAGNTAIVTLTVIDTTTPLAPAGLYAASIVGNIVTLRWTPPAAGAAPTDYVLEGGINPGEVLASITMGTNPIYTFPAPTGAFYVRVHTVSGATRSGPSNEIRIFVNVPAPPSAPADLVGLVNNSSVALAWRNTFEGGAPGGVVLDVTGSLTATLPLGLSNSFQFNGVPGGTYTLAVRAVNAAGSSPPSNAITLTFPGACTGAPLTPRNYLAYRIGRTIFVVWDPAAIGPAPTSYVLNVSGSFVGSFGTAGRSLSGTVGPGTYLINVGAQNACGASAVTATQTVVVP